MPPPLPLRMRWQCMFADTRPPSLHRVVDVAQEIERDCGSCCQARHQGRHCCGMVLEEPVHNLNPWPWLPQGEKKRSHAVTAGLRMRLVTPDTWRNSAHTEAPWNTKLKDL